MPRGSDWKPKRLNVSLRKPLRRLRKRDLRPKRLLVLRLKPKLMLSVSVQRLTKPSA